MENKISIFGGTGFIGKKFCNLYPDETVVISRESREPQTNQVLYFISTTHNYHVFTDPFLDIETNLSVLIQTLQECKDRDVVFNFVSSWFVYGDCKLPVKENTPCNPRGFYSITKKCAEDLLISYCQTFKIPYRIFRLGNIYGPEYKDASKKKNALQYMINCLKNNDPISLYHSGEFIRDYMHVDDVARALHLLIEKSPVDSIFNVGSGIPVRMKDIINEAVTLLSSKSKIESIDSPEFHKTVQVRDMYLDVSKLKNLGFQQKISLNEGIRELCLS